MTSLEFITRELSTTPDEIRSRCRKRDLVQKRWTIMWFYKLMGLSSVKIGLYFDLNHNTVLSGLERADESIREKAKELYCKFTNQEPDCKVLPRKTKTVRVPNYHTGEIVTKEVEI